MRVLNLLVVVALTATLGFSQSQMSSGDLKGSIVDASGAVLPKARVTATNIDTGVARETVSDDLGIYRFIVMPPGTYELKVQMASFATHTRRPVQVTIGQTVVVDVKLQLASIQQEVIVQIELPTIEPEKTQQSDTITRERIENLPINQRTFLDFSLLTPGVTDSKGLVLFGLPMAATSGLSFLGQGGRANSVTIDGVDNNDNAVAAVRSTMSQEAIQEFQINRSNYSAEFGRAQGGLINIVSKSGTNEMHGNVFAFFRDQAFDARNPFAFGEGGSTIDPPYSRQQAGFTLGGPFKKDRTFYFLSYEGLRQRESRFVTFLENNRLFQPTAAQQGLITALNASPSAQFRAIGATLAGALTTTEAAYPFTVRLLRANSGTFPFRNNDNTASFRVDHSLNAAHQMFGRLTFTDIDTLGGTFGGLKGPSRGTNFSVQDSAAVFGETHFFSPGRVNEFRFQYANRDYSAKPRDPYGPEINIGGVAQVGRDFFLPSTRNEKRYQFLDNVTMVFGKHEVKFGGDFNYLPFTTVTEVFLGGRFIFGEQVPLGLVLDSSAPGTSAAVAQGLAAQGRPDLVPVLSSFLTSLQSFNLNLPLAYQQGFGDPRAALSNKLMSSYVQDNFKVRPNLTLNAGLRYDFEFQPKPILRDKNNWSPRLGFSWAHDAKTVVRGGYGIYFAPIFEAVAFVGRVLDGTQISQVFVPLTGLPGLPATATSANVWARARALACPTLAATTVNSPNPCIRTLTVDDIAPLGIRPGVTPPVLLKTDPNIVNPYSQQFSLGIDREVLESVNLGVSYIGNHGLKIIRSRNSNLRQTGTNAYGPTFGPINPAKLQENYVESSASSIYHGLAISLAKRYSNHHQFQVSYTLSKAIDDSTDYITDLQPANQLNLRGERSLSSFDQRQRLVVSGVFQSPFESGVGIGKALANVTVAPIVTYSTGHPFNLLLGFDANGDTQANTDRPAGAGRNTGQGPDFFGVDLRIAKQAKFGLDGRYGLEGVFEAFNLLNRVNYSGVNGVVGNTAFTTFRVKARADVGPTDPLGYTSAFDPRQIQLGVKVRF